MWDHPSTKDFEDFLRQETPRGNARIVRHLLADCSTCRQLLFDPKRLQELVASWDYSRAFARAEHALNALFAKGKTANITSEELWAELSPLPQEQQERWVVTYRRFANPRLVHKLIKMSYAARHKDPTTMLHLAKLARLAAVACTVEAAGSGLARSDTKPE